MRDLQELNMNEGGRPVDRPAPSDREIADYETHFGVQLPDEYVMLLRHANGGHPELDGFQPQGIVEEELWGVDRFYHLGGDKDDLGGLWGVTTQWQAAVGKNVVPVASDGGGNQIMLRYGSSQPEVIVCVHDDNFQMIPVASSFGEFIDLLCEDPDMI